MQERDDSKYTPRDDYGEELFDPYSKHKGLIVTPLKNVGDMETALAGIVNERKQTLNDHLGPFYRDTDDNIIERNLIREARKEFGLPDIDDIINLCDSNEPHFDLTVSYLKLLFRPFVNRDEELSNLNVAFATFLFVGWYFNNVKFPSGCDGTRMVHLQLQEFYHSVVNGKYGIDWDRQLLTIDYDLKQPRLFDFCPSTMRSGYNQSHLIHHLMIMNAQIKIYAF